MRGWASVVVLSGLCGCRDLNPYFLEPPVATTGVTTGSDPTGPTGGDPQTGDESSTGTTDTTDTGSGVSATDTAGSLCEPLQISCDDGVANVCDPNGSLSTEQCAVLCIDGVGCGVCSPGEQRCAGAAVQECGYAGQWADIEVCDELQGLACDAGTFTCTGPCATDVLGTSNLGCDFYAVTLPSLHADMPMWSGFFAVVMVNDGADDATVTVSHAGLDIAQKVVAGGAADTVALAYLDEVVHPDASDEGPSKVVADGTYRVRADRPIAVYQYEPLLAESSGDASMLLPTHTWGTRHVVASHTHRPDFAGVALPGYYVVVAREDATTVTLSPSATSLAVAAGGGVASDGSGAVVLGESDVLVVFSASSGTDPETDLTGTIIDSDRPVSVLSGHKCAQLPADYPACDRLEEVMPPTERLGSEYVIAEPSNQFQTDEPHLVRIVASEDDTAVIATTYASPDATAIALTSAGDWIDLGPGFHATHIEADRKVLVVQYTRAAQGVVEPSMTVAVPADRHRASYRVFASSGYTYANATIVAPNGTQIEVNGEKSGGVEAIGDTGFGVIHIGLGGASDGSYLLSADAPFGVHVLGYSAGTSYWVPGGG